MGNMSTLEYFTNIYACVKQIEFTEPVIMTIKQMIQPTRASTDSVHWLSPFNLIICWIHPKANDLVYL